MAAEIPSSGSDRNPEIDRCLSLIAPAQPDESKFVGMLLLPRLFDHDRIDSVQRVFDGMNFKFIERLLRTNSQKSGSSGSDSGQVPEPVLREIAVNILACFAHYDTLATTKAMADRIPGLSTILTENDPTDTNKEALHIMLCVSVSKEGLVRMLDQDVLKNVLEFVVATNSKQERQLGMQLVLNTFSRACHMLHEKPVPSLASALKYALPVLFTALSKLLSVDQSSLKFDALETMSRILPDAPDEVMLKFKDENTGRMNGWLQDLRSGLRQLLSSKLVDNHRDQAMVLTACLLRYFGPDWLFSTLKKTKSSKRKSEKKPMSEPSTQDEIDTKFPVLFIHLVAVEARVILDDIHDRRLKLHNREMVVINPEKEQRQETMLPIFYEILESAIQYLSSNYHEDRATGIDPEILLKIRTTLTDTLNIVMELLRFLQDSSTDEELEVDMIAQASMRIVALYLAEEGYEL